MQNFKNFLTRINPIYFISAYFLLTTILIFFKIKPYDYNLSALIGIWKGFVILNPDLINKDFIVYNDGGYDGQFFYLISKSLFINGFSSFPVLDSFYLRFNRVGLSLLSGFFSSLFGFNLYPIITLFLLVLFHIYSFVLLRGMLDQENKYLAYFYLFSPFSLNSILLLVSDSLFVSFSIICIFLLEKIGISIFSFNQTTTRRAKSIYLLTTIVLTFTCLIRESGLILLFTFLLFCFLNRKFKVSIPIFLAIGFYITFVQLIKVIPNVYAGTNPLGFLDLIDYPFLGFYKSIQHQTYTDVKSVFRELAKFPIFIFYLLLAFNLKNIKNYRDLLLFLPIVFILFTAGVGEIGYWLSFDNISRMFALSTVWLILLKNKNQKYNDYYALLLGFIILFLLTIRLIYIKSPMTFFIY